jgi:molecular chaperone GrpE
MTKQAEEQVAEQTSEQIVEQDGTIEPANAQNSDQNSIENSDQTNGQANDQDSATAESARIEQLQAAVAAEKARADELLDKWQRATADFQNSRRRLERQQADEIEQANGQLIKRLLPVVDDLNLAFNNLPASQQGNEGAWVDGFRQIQRKLSGLLEEQGVVAISPEGAFDPARHEAVMSEASESVASGHVISTLRTGYEYRGRVLRPALVRIAS